MRRHAFRAMGTSVTVIVDDDRAAAVTVSRAIAEAERIFDREDRRYSRFRADSELSWVNASAGSQTTLSPPFAQLLAFALERAADSGGLFDPTVLGAVTAAGYDRDFDELIAGARGALRPAVPCGRWREISLDGRELRMPASAGLDLGGVAKGWTVDLVAEAVVAAGLPWALVNAGGDLRVAGDAPPVEIEVEDPADPGTALARLSMTAGAVATSSTMRRAWGDGLHHLIDPRTGAPSDTGVVQATVWAPTCALAEVAAKRALLTGDSALDLGPAVLVRSGGDVRTNLGPVVAPA
jgi:thiamine biosynthesis lipoprotein